MKKEKQVKSYQRRTKSGKMVTVRAHTATYDADKAKEAAKKKGAGKELEERMTKKPTQLEIPFDKEEEKKVLDEVKETAEKESAKKPFEKKTTKKVRPVGSGTNGPAPKKKSDMRVAKTETAKPASSEPAFTAAEFKEWYRGTGSAADKKVAKALRAQLGRSGYRKLEDEAIDNYSSRGHLSMFKRVSGGSGTSTKTASKASSPSKKELLKRTAEMHKREKAFEKGPRQKADAPIKASTSDDVKKAIKNTYSGFLGGKAAKDAISTLEKNGFKKKQIYSDGNYKQNVYVSPDGKSGYFSDGTTLSIASRSQINAKPKSVTYFRKSSDVPRNVTNAVNKIYRYIDSKAAAEELSKLPDKDYNKVASGDTKALASLYKKHLKINKLKPVHMELVEKISKSLSKKK